MGHLALLVDTVRYKMAHFVPTSFLLTQLFIKDCVSLWYHIFSKGLFKKLYFFSLLSNFYLWWDTVNHALIRYP